MEAPMRLAIENVDYGNNPEFSAAQHRKQAAFRQIQDCRVKIITVATAG